MSRLINWEYVYERPLTPHKCSGWPQRSLEADYQPLNNCFTKWWKLLIFFSKISIHSLYFTTWSSNPWACGLVVLWGLWTPLPYPQIPYPPQVQLGPNLVPSLSLLEKQRRQKGGEREREGIMQSSRC